MTNPQYALCIGQSRPWHRTGNVGYSDAPAPLIAAHRDGLYRNTPASLWVKDSWTAGRWYPASIV